MELREINPMPIARICSQVSSHVILSACTLVAPSVFAQEPSRIDGVVTASWIELQNVDYPLFQVRGPALVSQSNYFAQFQGSDWTKSAGYQYNTSVPAPQVFAIW